MGRREETLRTIIILSVLLVVLATLGLTIAILVTVLNNNDSKHEENPYETSYLINVKQPTEADVRKPYYSAYQSASHLLKQNLNTKVDPCSDFYKYTCGNFNDTMSFDISDLNNYGAMAKQLNDVNYVTASSKPVQQLSWYLQQCKTARMSWNTTIKSGSYVMDAIHRLADGNLKSPTSTKFPFPMLYQDKNVTDFPDAVGIGYFIGKLIGSEGISNVVSAYTDTNWKDPHGARGYSIFLDQPTTIYPSTYYRKTGTTIDTLAKEIRENMKRLAKTQDIDLDEGKLFSDVADVAKFDYYLALSYSTNDVVRRKYDRSYNPMTLSTLTDRYSGIDWSMLIEEALNEAADEVKEIVKDANFKFIVMEPLIFSNLQNLFNKSSKSDVTPRTLINYFYYRIVHAYEDFLPYLNSTTPSTKMNIVQPKIGRSRYIKAEERKFHRMQEEDENSATLSCIAETVELIQYANARVFIDYLYPTPQSRADVKKDVAKMVESIIVAFRSMIDQLSWMTRSTKKGAYDKIDNLVKNIAYPEWITDDGQLVAYHEHLNITETDVYLKMVRSANLFNIFTSWNTLTNGATKRDDFNGAPGTTNAWYQPQLNSITFPAAILQPPFYNPSWPTAINFGAMGVIAGHELTHGFDDEGVQWDGTGVLNGWMDTYSADNFHNMSTCVVKEYDKFCPLPISKYSAAACIDGEQTQGENIADNGGIHAAYRAYHNYINLNGADAQLPDQLMRDFTADQLFFLSFARVWCQTKPDDNHMLTQLLVDPHSPSKYRVWGTLQNFPAFKNAFNCPADDVPKKCDVWVSDINPGSPGIPVIKTDLNIPQNPQITAGDMAKYNSYEQAVGFYQSSVNLSADPCNDFWKYSCGNYQLTGSFDTVNGKNLITMVDKLLDPDYVQKRPALLKTKQFFDACRKATKDTSGQDMLKSKKYLKKKVHDLTEILGSGFTYVYGGTAKRPTPHQLAEALGWLSFHEGIDTFITPSVDTNWEDPTNYYFLFLDQSTAHFGKTFYQNKAFVSIRENYIETILHVIANYTTDEKPSRIPSKEEIGKIVDFEQVLALDYSSPDEKRRQSKRSWNVRNLADLAKYSFIEWSTYIRQIPSVAGVTETNFKASIMEEEMYSKMSSDYAKADPETLVNYLFIRLLLEKSQFMPSYKNSFKNMPEEPFVLGRRRRPYSVPLITPLYVSNCMKATNTLMQYSSGRVFIDSVYPREEDKIAVRKQIREVIDSVITSFQGMINELNWMSPKSKNKAIEKTLNIQKNIAFPDWITDDKALNEYYSGLKFDSTDNYYDMWQKLIQFNINLNYQQLKTKASRDNFLGQPAIVNAWYQPELNSITIPAGILQQPYYDPNWPESINYGGLGIVAGHELTHGFDDEGVQWDAEGKLNSWMDKNSTDGFNNMASCVIEEYDGFCPFTDQQKTPNCVNGIQTQGENIADNGGIHAAYRAYRIKVAENGIDPRLPDRVFGQFTHDQLFFLNFAQVWCETPRSDDMLYRQLMVDPHSPAQYRVFGTIQNYPAFRAAYNCPANSRYAPKKHCNVWVNDNSQ